MLEFVVLVKKQTLIFLNEHARGEVRGVLEINDSEALILLSADVIRMLLDLAEPEDERIDDVIVRLAL